jgi:hypothetical protein
MRFILTYYFVSTGIGYSILLPVLGSPGKKLFEYFLIVLCRVPVVNRTLRCYCHRLPVIPYAVRRSSLEGQYSNRFFSYAFSTVIPVHR